MSSLPRPHQGQVRRQEVKARVKVWDQRARRLLAHQVPSAPLHPQRTKMWMAR